MSSSPIPVAVSAARGRYFAGSRSFAAIGQWAADAGTGVLASLGASRGAAEESTFRRAFALVNAETLDRVLGAWLWTKSVLVTGRRVIAVDGKTVRGARDRNGQAPHLVAALAHGIGTVLGQVAVAAKTNEIPAVRDLLAAFADLAGAVITIAPERAGRERRMGLTVESGQHCLSRADIRQRDFCPRVPSAAKAPDGTVTRATPPSVQGGTNGRGPGRGLQRLRHREVTERDGQVSVGPG
ncbi:ISAs1 family transposase [Amycolatopsis sp.]|uniref:ISAs1 family transposase n=1 Tax=Amycolatopsis sp. TaxID=37632 RepID=UPI0039C8807B